MKKKTKGLPKARPQNTKSPTLRQQPKEDRRSGKIRDNRRRRHLTMPYTYMLFPVGCTDLLCIRDVDAVWIFENEITRWRGSEFLEHLKHNVPSTSFGKIELLSLKEGTVELALLRSKALLDFFSESFKVQEKELTASSGWTCEMMDPSVPF